MFGIKNKVARICPLLALTLCACQSAEQDTIPFVSYDGTAEEWLSAQFRSLPDFGLNPTEKALKIAGQIESIVAYETENPLSAKLTGKELSLTDAELSLQYAEFELPTRYYRVLEVHRNGRKEIGGLAYGYPLAEADAFTGIKGNDTTIITVSTAAQAGPRDISDSSAIEELVNGLCHSLVVDASEYAYPFVPGETRYSISFKGTKTMVCSYSSRGFFVYEQKTYRFSVSDPVGHWLRKNNL